MSNYASYDASAKEWTRRWGSLGKLVAESTGPTKSTTGFSGNKNCLVFDGSSNVGLSLASPGFTEITVAFALNVTEANTGVYPVLWNRSTLGIGISGTQFTETYGVQTRYGNGTVAEYYGLSMPSQLLLVSRHSSASRITRIDGAQVAIDTTADGATPPDSTASFKVCRWLGSGTNWTVQIAAIGIFTSSSWSTGLAEKIEGFIAHNNLGNTTAILPPGHTYKSAAP